MTKRPGRPPKERKQEKFVGFWVTKMQYFVIQQKMKKAGVNISDYLRQTAINGQVKPRWTEEQRGAVRRLVDIAQDVNRIVEVAEKEGANQAALLFVSHRDVMDATLKALYNDR